MDKALKTALVAVASGAERNETEIKKEEDEEDDDDGEEDRRRERAKWIYEFVSSTLPGSRHQVCMYVVLNIHTSIIYNVHVRMYTYRELHMYMYNVHVS